MTGLREAEIAAFWRDGAIVVEDVATPAELAALRRDLDSWVEDSRSRTEPYGEMLDGRPRFDLEPGHSAAAPALRRVASPTEISDAYAAVAFDSRLADIAAELVGPALRFHHSKINSKLPGAATVVKWHQDFPFDPHSNDDLITALLFLDEVTPENGPLLIAPGSHKGPLLSHWRQGHFVGAVADEHVAGFEQAATPCFGPAGAACFMHARAAHASSANRSAGPRALFIVAYAAADAMPLAPLHVPSVHAGRMVRGVETGRVRCSAFEMELPEKPTGASFFVHQAEAG